MPLNLSDPSIASIVSRRYFKKPKFCMQKAILRSLYFWSDPTVGIIDKEEVEQRTHQTSAVLVVDGVVTVMQWCCCCCCQHTTAAVCCLYRYIIIMYSCSDIEH